MRKLQIPLIGNENAILAILLLATTLLLVQQGWLSRIDHNFYDLQLGAWKRPANPEIILVTVDDHSMEVLGGWPWPAEYFSNLLINIGVDNPRSVGFFFSIPALEPGQGTVDEALLNAMRETQHLVLSIEPGSQAEMTIAADQAGYLYRRTGALTGQPAIIRDSDGVVRSTAKQTGSTARLWDNSSLLMANPGHTDLLNSQSTVSNNPGNNIYREVDLDIELIPFSGPPGHFKSVSIVDVINGDTPPGLLTGKFVLVGMTTGNMARAYPVPNAGFENPMPLVEISANNLAAVLTDRLIRPADTSWVMIFSGLFALIPFFIYPFFSPRGNITLTVILLLITALISLMLVMLYKVWLPPTAAMLALTLSYLLWSSRRLANAVQYLDNQLAQLNTNIPRLNAGIERDVRPVFHYLERIFPISGWVITDQDNTILAHGGNPPEIADKDFKQDHWSDDGVDYWTSMRDGATTIHLGVRWRNTPDGSRVEKMYLDSLVRKHLYSADRREYSSHELVQNLIQQVQGAIINLRDTHTFLDGTLLHMANGVIVTSDAGEIILLNRRAAEYLARASSDELVGCDLIDSLSSLDFNENHDITGLLHESIKTGTPVIAQCSNNHGQDLLLQIAPFAGESGQPGNTIINLSDISHLKSVERARNETLSFLSHDLRSPLVSILALLELAKNRDASDEVSILHSRIESYTKLTINLAEQFIQLARVESDANIHFEIIDFVSTAINAHEQMWVQAQAKSIRMVRNISIDHGWVNGDSGLLERAVMNLLNNAIKYSPEGSTIVMNVRRSKQHIWCCIEDEGYGIPENELPMLFERFRRAHLNSGDDHQGIGLGLALVKATAERHGGHVDVTSKQGEGSRFCLVLPESALESQNT